MSVLRVLACSNLCVGGLSRSSEAGVLPLGGAGGNVPVISSCRVFDGSPTGGQIWIQEQVLVCPDVVCRDTETSVLLPASAAVSPPPNQKF